jgi:hypothetical protein
MLDLFAFREFREGLAMMRDGEAERAMGLLRQASERDPENPYYLSYYGLSLAYAESGQTLNGCATPPSAATDAKHNFT